MKDLECQVEKSAFDTPAFRGSRQMSTHIAPIPLVLSQPIGIHSLTHSLHLASDELKVKCKEQSLPSCSISSVPAPAGTVLAFMSTELHLLSVRAPVTEHL